MIDLDKLNRMLDAALEAESVESLDAWMEEQIRADRNNGIIRNADFGILFRSPERQLSVRQEVIIERGMTEYISYHSSCEMLEEFDVDSNNSYNLAA